MNLDEFAFFNQQLGRMLKDGIPLEGALKRLCSEMRRSRVRAELEALGNDLADGRPLDAALEARRLPDLYVRLLRMGAKSDALPDILLMLADHYQRVNTLWTRLKGLMVYPVLVLLVAVGVSVHVARVLYQLTVDTNLGVFETRRGTASLSSRTVRWLQFDILAPPGVLTLLLVLVLTCVAVPALRRRLRWWLPPFKDAALARVASVLSLVLRGGAPLADAVDMTREMEGQSPAAKDLAEWKARLAGGRTRFADIALANGRFPKLFIWLVDSAGEDLPGGFAQAAEVYQERASHRAEMALYGVLPVSILTIGGMLFAQAYVIMATINRLLNQVMERSSW